MRVLLVAVLIAFACERDRSDEDGAGSSDQHAASPADSAKPGAASPAPAESVVQADSTPPRVELTQGMQQVLQDSLPGFAAWSMEHYAPEVRSAYRTSQRQVPWAVLGDFNGDSLADIVLDGTDGHQDMRVVLLSTPTSYRLLRLKEAPMPIPFQTNAAIEALMHRAPGTVLVLDCPESGDCRKVPFELEADAFEVVYWEKASELWYWNGNAFSVLLTSD